MLPPKTKTTATGHVSVHFDKKDMMVVFISMWAPAVKKLTKLVVTMSLQKLAETTGKALNGYLTLKVLQRQLISGLDYKASLGHAVVIHDASGARIGCGILEK